LLAKKRERPFPRVFTHRFGVVACSNKYCLHGNPSVKNPAQNTIRRIMKRVNRKPLYQLYLKEEDYVV
jgi:hypothetical protein